MRELDIKKCNILECSDNFDKTSKLLEVIFEYNFSDNAKVYFFDECFNGVEYYPENPSMGGPIKMRNSDIDGLLTVLRSVVVGGRTNITVMVNFNTDTLKNSGCFDLLRDFCNNDNNCNLVLGCTNMEDFADFKFDHKVNV